MHDSGLFSNPGVYMKTYIREHFSQLLGPYVSLLDEPNGLELLAALVRCGEIPPRPPA